MNQTQHSTRRPLTRFYAVPVLLLLLLTCGAVPETAQAQWTTGTNISNTNPGNVGIGTTTPATKLDIVGTAKAEAFNIGGAAAEKTFTLLWGNDVAHQKVQVYWPANTQVDGIFEITVTGHYWHSNTNGGIRKRIVINGRGDIGVINMQQAEVPFRLGFTGYSNTISNIMWDAANARYYFIVSNLDNKQNGITIHVKSITPGVTAANADGMNVTPIYTTDTTAYPQLFTSFMDSNVGIGTTAPAYKLDVNGEINATGLRINGTPIGTGGPPSPWTTNGSNVYYNTGNVGIGAATPLDRFHIESGANDQGLFIRNSLTSANATNRISFANGAVTATAMIESVKVSSSSVATDLKFWVHNGAGWNFPLFLKHNGYVGIGTTAPANQLHVHNPSGGAALRISGGGYSAINFIDSNAPANSRLFQWRSESGLFRMVLVNDNENTYLQPNLLVANAAGNVGIGTASPAVKLDVAGQVKSSSGGFVFPDGTVQATAATGGGSVAASNITPGQFGAGNYIFAGNVDISGSLTWGNSNSRTDWKHDAGAIASKSGFFETNNPVNYPAGATSWWHMMESRHQNSNNNYALQIAGSFFDQNLYVRKTHDNGMRPWSKFVLQDSDGNTAIGASASSTLNVQGNINVSGNINAKYQDVAEWVESSQKLEAGTVVALDPEKSNQVVASSEAYDTKVAGVISAQPGISLGEPGEGKVLVATTGRVKVRVDATRTPIKIGDLLVTSDVAGVAMKSEPIIIGGRRMHAPGTLIGKALESLEKGTGEILVLLSLQ